MNILHGRFVSARLLSLGLGVVAMQTTHPAPAASNLSIEELPAPNAASPAKAKVASMLVSRTAAIRKEAQECASLGGDSAFTSKARVLLDTAWLYSIEVRGRSHCGSAAHPNTWQYALTYDMTTGKRYHPLSLYAVGAPANGGQVRLAPEVESLVKADLRAEASADCRPVIDAQWPSTAMAFGLSYTGLHIFFAAPHAVQACFPTVTLPFSKIGHFLNLSEANRLHWRPPGACALQGSVINCSE